MELEEIDKKINTYRYKSFNIENFMNLIRLIELKIYKIYNEEDIRPFSSLIKEVDLSDDIIKYFINLRNLVAHGFITNDELQSNEKLIKNIIIPSILSFPEDNLATRAISFENKTKKKLKKIGERFRFKVETNSLIRLGISRLEVDIIFVKYNKKIIFEIKYTENNGSKYIGVQQLIKRLIACSTPYGVLILPGKTHEIIEKENAEILIFGIDLKQEILENWLIQKVSD